MERRSKRKSVKILNFSGEVIEKTSPFFVQQINKTIMQTLKLSIEDHIAHVIINRPEKANALNQTAWDEITEVFQQSKIGSFR